MINILFQQLLVMFAMLGLGAWMRKKGMMSETTFKDLGVFLLYVISPIVVFRGYLVPFTDLNTSRLIMSSIVSLVLLLMIIAIAAIIYRKDGLSIFASIFTNSGFMGIPLVLALFSQEAVFILSPFLSWLFVIQWTLGIVVITKDITTMSFKKVILNPVILATIFGVIVYALQIHVPEVVNEFLSRIGAMLMPVAMIVLGSTFVNISFKKMLRDSRVWVMVLVRLFVLPLFVVLALTFIAKDYELVAYTLLVAMSAPIGANVAILAQQYDRDTQLAASQIMMTTLFSIISMPLMVWIAQMLWRSL
ncbi:MAG: AEC family transporter [Erysipelothrix sp.]|jgi:predicted permease|nr:AEC family transporter [Erysipelothrix sp.]